MKPEFFVVAFCLLFTGAYVVYAQHTAPHSDRRSSSMTINTGDDYIQVKYAGDLQFDSTETAILHISPGGYFKYTHNDKRLLAESNKKGEITYELYDGDTKLTPEGEGKKLVTEAIASIVSRGFHAEERMERIYQRGGDTALFNALAYLQSDYVKVLYMERLLNADTLTAKELTQLVHATGELGNDHDKTKMLKKFTRDDLLLSDVNKAWFEAAASIGSDNDKVSVLKKLIEQGPLSAAMFANTIDIANKLGSDADKSRIYSKLSEEKNLTVAQWSDLITATSHISSDVDKSNLLIQYAPYMPKDAEIRAIYLQAAKTISGDAEYARVVRPIQ